MRVAYGIYIAVVTFFISVMRRGESLSFGDVWIIFAYILIPAFLYIIMKGAMNKSVKNSDIEMKTLNDISDEPTREQFQVMHVFHSFFPWFKNRK